MRTLKSTTTTTASTSTAMMVDSASAPAAAAMQRSPWHSPVPYLFGGLAAMLGLIAFALLILACSYWKLSGQLNGENNGDDLESGDGDEKKCKDGKGKGRVVYGEQFVVIMAGDQKPTCLAMPVVCSRSSATLFNLSNDQSDGSSNDGISGDEKAAAGVADGSVKIEMGLEEEEVDVHQRQSDEEAEERNNSSMNSEQSDQLHLQHLQHHKQLEPAESSNSSS